jgi:hypothetical protein
MKIFAWLERVQKFFHSGQKQSGSKRVVRRFRLDLEVLEDRRLLAALVVTNVGDGADTDVGTLRWAIVQVNNGNGDAINFDTADSQTPETINLNSALPAITAPVFINGFSQILSSIAGPGIELNGQGLTGDGLTINSGE